MSSEFNYEQLYYIRTRGNGDKRPLDKWGGYGQAFDEADDIYRHDELTERPHDTWAVCGVTDGEHTTRSLLILDLDVHKADADFDPNDIGIADRVPLVKSQNGGFHAYAIIDAERGSAGVEDFHVPHQLSWGVDIRGSLVSHHVVAPADIPGVETAYEIVGDTDIPGYFHASDFLEDITYQGEPLVEYDPGTSVGDIDFERETEPPDEMPTCYANGLALRATAVDDPNYNSHQANVLTALCGLAAGYSVEDVVTHFVDEFPPEDSARMADREKTRYQVEHIAEKMEAGQYAAPALSTLTDAGILDSSETCDCEIDYHGGDDENTLTDEELWHWWADARVEGQLGGDALIPDGALRYLAREHTEYDYSAVPDGYDGIPWRPARLALDWLETEWARDELGIDPYDEDETRQATERDPPAPDREDTHTWDGVRALYREASVDDGRYAAVLRLRDEHTFLTPEDTEELHVYDPKTGIYTEGARYDIGRRLDRELGKYYSQHEKTEILGRLREVTVSRDRLEAGDIAGTYLCVTNGVLDLDERELLEHDEKWLFTRRVPVEYDPTASCPRVREFLADITRRDADWKTMVQCLGAALLPGYPYESFLVLFGRGSNGKSTWYNVCRAFLGSKNVTNIPLHTLADDDFAASQLVGKLANIGGDLPQTKITDVGDLKDLTGGGEVWAQRKGEQGFDFTNRAQMMFAANEPPVLGERSHAVARRILPVRLPHRYTSDEDDDHKDIIHGIEEDLQTDAELSGLLNLVLDELADLRATGDFALPESPEERLEYYEQFSDHIKMFGVNCLQNEAGERESKADVYNAYTAFCDEKGRDPVGKQTFWRQLRKTTLDISIVRPMQEGSRKRMADNLTFTSRGREHAPHYDTETPDVPQIAALGTDETDVTVEGRIKSVDTDQPEAIAEKATLVDVTGEICVTVWADADKPALEEGQPVRLKNVDVNEYEGQPEVSVQQYSGIEELSDGVGNVPAADPGSNEQLDEAAADGGQTASEADDEVEQPDPLVMQAVLDHEDDHPDGVPEVVIVGELAKEGFDASQTEHAIETLACEKGDLIEPRDGHYRSNI